ncbi:MAG: chorismate mutase [Pseudomonadota bacterium]
MTMTPPNSTDQSTTSKELEELRARIDAVDTAMQDLLIERSEIVEKVAAVKRGGPTTRPGREATLMRRLVERHRGKFPRRALVQVWREIIVGHSRIQGPYRVAAFAPAENTDFVDLARAHFGASTELSSFASVSQVIAAVTDGKAEVAVLPVPSDGDPDPWWRKIVSGDSKRPRIVTRLPFAARSNGVEALVIAKATPEPTGADRGYFAMETTHDISRSRLSSLLGEAGITPVFWTILPDRGAQDITVNLVEVDGFLGDGDHRLAELAQKEPNAIHWIQVLGSYALPIPESDLR